MGIRLLQSRDARTRLAVTALVRPAPCAARRRRAICRMELKLPIVDIDLVDAPTARDAFAQ
jgi:hypothetical protein